MCVSAGNGSGMTAARGYAPINTAIWRLTQPVICYPNCYYCAPSTWLISWERWCAAKGHSLQSHRVVKPCQSSSQKSKALKNFQRLLTFQLQAWISLEKRLSGSGERFWCFLWFSVYVQANLLCWPPPYTVNTARQYFICKVHLIASTCRGIKKRFGNISASFTFRSLDVEKSHFRETDAFRHALFTLWFRSTKNDKKSLCLFYLSLHK